MLDNVKKDTDLNEGPLKQLVNNSTQATNQLNTLLEATNKLLQSIQEPGNGSMEDRNAISRLMQELEETARSIRELANMLHETPEVLIKGK